MHRRVFLKRQALLCGSAWLGAHLRAATRDRGSPLSQFKLGAISDGFSQDFEQALVTMKSYGLAWVEIREVFGIYNTEASNAQIQRLKELLHQYQFQVSVIDSALYKCTLPGTKPVGRQKDIHAYQDQLELLKRACDRAHLLGTDKIRGFTFWRVEAPEKLADRLAEELGRASEIARRNGMRIVIENEESCNVATGRELSDMLSKSPARNLGVNWDVGNGLWRGENSFPDGYSRLNPKRVWHLHLKGVTCGPGLQNCSESLADQSQIDLLGQLRRLLHDGYQETMSLECEFKAAGLTHLETSKRSLEGLIRIMAAAVADFPG